MIDIVLLLAIVVLLFMQLQVGKERAQFNELWKASLVRAMDEIQVTLDEFQKNKKASRTIM